jgi:ankyrin repeat protein
MTDTPLLALMRAIAAGRTAAATRELARAALETGASRQSARDYFLQPPGHYVYAGDTVLHVAAAAYQVPWIARLVGLGAAVGARNRRGAEPLHYAADGSPTSARWDPGAQAKTISALIRAGADPNATDDSGVAPLHRAVRTRCASAVEALLAGGANPTLPNRRGSTPLELAGRTTGRGGSGSPEAKAQQAEILRILESAAR